MSTLHFQNTTYLTGAADMTAFSPDFGSEIAYVGRSNAGKSSALNAITGIKGLARTSRSPGRTQLIHFFEIDHLHRLVDLPGYGYAKIQKSVKTQWALLIHDYLQSRKSLKGLILVMDIRHPLKTLDLQLISWCVDMEMPLHILLTKADKLNISAQKNVVNHVKNALAQFQGVLSVQLFSALKNKGVDEARAKLMSWFK